MHKFVKFGLAVMLGGSLSGCIAAAAVPILAGTGVVGSRVVDGNNDDEIAKAAIPRPPFDRTASSPAPAVTPGPAEIAPEPSATAVMTADSGLAGPATSVAELDAVPANAAAAETPIDGMAAIPVPAQTPAEPAAIASPSSTTPPATAPGGLPPVQLTLPDGRQIAVGGGGVQPSATGQQPPAALAQIPGRPSATPSAVDQSAYSRFYDFAMANSVPLKRGERRNSALLTAPGALSPDTGRCGVTQPAILIDLDPGEELLDPTARFAANPPLAQALASLRERNVSVHWISGNSAAFAGALRSRLEEAGLDPDGRDELVLMRYPDDRKQVRRRAVGATHCLVAIAGEERADFDELYQYLKSPDAAIALEALVGRGWFLIPPALVNKDEN